MSKTMKELDQETEIEMNRMYFNLKNLFYNFLQQSVNSGIISIKDNFFCIYNGEEWVKIKEVYPADKKE